MANIPAEWLDELKSTIFKTCDKYVELESLKAQASKLTNILNKQIKVIEEKGQMMQTKTNKLFDCDLKASVDDDLYPTNRKYLGDMNDLLNQVKMLDD